MNRAFKRLMQGGILNTPDTMIKFTFEGKNYTALEGDSIKMALLANNITHYHRSVAGYFLSSASGLYPIITNITDNHLNHHRVATEDFKITNGLKLSQTNKPNLTSKLRSLIRMFKSSTGIHNPVTPIKAYDITASLIDKTHASKEVAKFSEKMRFDTEKSYIHTDIAIIGTNIFALQAALILADAGLRVVICNNYKDTPFDIFNNKNLQSLFHDLQSRIKNHKNITLKTMVEISLVCDNTEKTAQIMGINHAYSYDNTATPTHKQQHSVELLVVNARHILYAPCLEEIGFLFQGHHLPAVMGCREFMDLHLKFGLMANHNSVLYVTNDMAYDVLSTTGITPDKVNAIIDTRPTMTQTMIDAEKAGFKIYAGYVVTHATGKDAIQNVTFKSLRGDKDALVKSVSCNLLLCSSGYELDISLFKTIPDALNIDVSDDYRISVGIDTDFLAKNHISLLGYAMHNPQDTKISKQTVFHICSNILKNYGATTEFCENPDITKIMDMITWQQPEFYDVHDLCRKDKLLFPQDIHYHDFIQILYRYDKPLSVIDALKQHHNFYDNHRAIRILMIQMQKIYNLSPDDITQFYQQIMVFLANTIAPITPHKILDTMSTCGQPKPHILPAGDKEKMDISNDIITPDNAICAVDIDRYYHSIKNYSGVRAFNKCHIIDITGSDTHKFIQTIIDATENTIKFPPLNIGEHFLFSQKNTQNPVIIIHYADNRYCMIIPQHNDLKTHCDVLYSKNTDFQIIVNNVTQSWAYLQLIGQQALDVFEKIIKQPIPQQTTDLWIENIQLRFIIHTRFNIPHIEVLIISDAAESFYEKIIQKNFNIIPFGHNIYNMFALEAGAIFDTTVISDIKQDTVAHTDTSFFTTQALAMPLVKLDNPLSGGSIYPDKHHTDEAPLGITLPTMIYSPFYNQYVFPTLLKGDFQQWENKIVSVISKDGQETTQVKIISDKMLKIQEVA